MSVHVHLKQVSTTFNLTHNVVFFYYPLSVCLRTLKIGQVSRGKRAETWQPFASPEKNRNLELFRGICILKATI